MTIHERYALNFCVKSFLDSNHDLHWGRLGRSATATSALSQAQKDLADAQQKAEQIRADGKARAEAIRLDSEKRTVEEMARVKQGAAADLDAEAARVTGQLRREAARLAIEKALASLPGMLSPEAQAKLVNQSINTLGNA